MIEENITDSIVNNIKIDCPNEDDFLVTQTTEQIDKDRIKEEIEKLQIDLTMSSKDFETTQNIEDEKQNE